MATIRQALGWDTTNLIKNKTKEKLFSFKNTSYLALLLVEFFLTMMLVGGITLYLDGRFNELEMPYNFLIFAAIAWGVLYFYSYTRKFRQNRNDEIQRNNTMKTLVLEFVIFLIIILSAYVYYDPAINLLPNPFNVIFFLLVLAVPVYFYISEKFLKAQN